MKKTILFLLLLLGFHLVHAEITPFSSKSKSLIYQKINSSNKDTVYVLIFNGITSNTDVSFDGNPASIEWYKYDNQTVPVSTGSTTLYQPDDYTGYLVVVDNKKYNLWIIDYKKHMPVLNSVTPDVNSVDVCKTLVVNIGATVSPLIYKSSKGNSYNLSRNFTLAYCTQKWTSSDSKWAEDSVHTSIELPATSVSVTAPLCNTYFKLSGDQYAIALGIDSISKRSSLYTAVAVECHITSVVTERSATNEDTRPQNSTPISYSAPFDVEFKSNPNETNVNSGTAVATSYLWTISKNQEVLATHTDKNIRYTFSDYGTYIVKSTVSNATCSYTDSTTVNTEVAEIQAPNVFTPDGNGLNDEFRICYKSLLNFECWIYNRWGRLVYHWTDPTKGWDGKINGKDAAQGVYFYVVKATGFGLNPKKNSSGSYPKSTIIKKGDVTLLRGKQ